jgi:hypothetical protein
MFKLSDAEFNNITTGGQVHIFLALIKQSLTRVQILCSTQYGKSLVVALACIILSCIFKRKVVIVAPSGDKAKIIMRYFVEHLGDNPLFYSQLEKTTRLERLRQEENKERIIFRGGGSIFIISANERNSQKKIESAMGEGGDVVIIDEACLVSDEVEATVFRMIAGRGVNAKYVKIGNPFYRLPPYSHFYNSWINPNYYRVFIDEQIALNEKRYSLSFLEEAETKPFYDILFKCRFPEEDTMDSHGYRPLIISTDIKYGMTEEIFKSILKKDIDKGGLKHSLMSGNDIGGGGDYNTYVLRYGPFAIIKGYNQSDDTMVNVAELEKIAKEYEDLGWRWENCNIDDIGVGQGVSDRLLEKGYPINKVNVGESAIEKDIYSNLKAELYWSLRIWLKKPITRLDESDKWIQLTWIRYKVNSDKQLKIEPKKDLKERTKKSPDFAEGLMLTFNEPSYIGFA